MTVPPPGSGWPKVLVTDLDNTLWDWFEAWYQSFAPMLEKVGELSGVPVETLEREMRLVHQARGTTEYSFLLDEVPSLVEAAKDRRPIEAYDAALHVLNSARKKHTRLYPGVAETLNALRANGIRIVAYTESLAYWTQWRIQSTGLDGVIDVLYSAPDHEWPAGLSAASVRKQPPSAYELAGTDHRFVPRGSTKPNPAILTTILDDAGVLPGQAIYVGDSLMKDVAMAQDVGVLDVHASYGVVRDGPEYDLLRRVSHWTEADVQREIAIANNPSVLPAHVLDRGFAQLLPLFGIEDLKIGN